MFPEVDRVWMFRGMKFVLKIFSEEEPQAFRELATFIRNPERNTISEDSRKIFREKGFYNGDGKFVMQELIERAILLYTNEDGSWI